MTFKERVLTVVQTIPSGEVMTYKEVAVQAGSPRAFRAVGTIMANNRDLSVPCHRVVCTDRFLGGYNGGIERKERLLKQEGVKIHNKRVIL